MPIDLIAIAFDQILELAKEKSKRSDKILKALNAIGLKQDAPLDKGFDGVYAYTLVVYGIDKPKPILEFFRHEFIKSAFRKSFEQRDVSILEKETENFLDWNEIGKDIIAIDYDPKREFTEFQKQFIAAAKLTRTVHEVLVDHELKKISSQIQGLPKKQDLEEIIKETQKTPILEKPSWASKDRILEAAVEKEVTVGKPTQLFALVKRLDSQNGLLSIIHDTDEEIILDEDNVKSKGFNIEFPIRDGQVLPTDIVLKLEAFDFLPKTQEKKLIIPPDGDSVVCVFVITPEVPGKLLLSLEVLSKNKSSLATRTLRTNAIEAEKRNHSKNIVTIPIFVLVEPSANIYVGGDLSGNIIVGDENNIEKPFHLNEEKEYTVFQHNNAIEELIGKVYTPETSKNDNVKHRGYIPIVLPPIDISLFTGRRRELVEIRDLFNYKDTVIITGRKGIGKSALITFFAYKYKELFPDGVISVKVNGLTNYEIAYRFASLAEKRIDLNLTAHEIMQKLFFTSKSLLIFENADNIDIRELMPSNGSCKSIITTQNLQTFNEMNNFGLIHLHRLSLEESLHLLESYIGEGRVRQDIPSFEKIYKLLRGTPVAIVIIGKMLQENNRLTLRECVEILERQAKPLTLHDQDDKSLYWIDDIKEPE